MPSAHFSPRQTSSWDSDVLGGWDIAICLTIFLQGVLCAQFAHYLTLSKRDSIRLKLFVAGLALLTTLRSSQCLAIMWIQNVTLFGHVEAASQMWEVHWLSKIDLMFEATGTFYVQMFFCRRLWASISLSIASSLQRSLKTQVISRNRYILGICLVLYTVGLASAGVDTFFLFTAIESTETTGWGALHLGVVLCGDLLLTGSTIFYLLSAAPSAMCALINFIDTLRLYNAGTFMPELLMIDFITNMILPQMYAWSALWTLNSREDIRVAVDNRPYTVALGTAMVPLGLQVSEHESETPRRWNHSNSQPPRKV
ncbi:hypothetical protein MSAN_00107500 [Mycena sanguinolenta]|uniref:Uncharacterized protein n=1 Tax=Mycena sanguinolenta TaxID=230812 RepID=A0A8H6ZDE8_9AGAR|nr:hypothetical protein MSAN_00107500 [Mycena sanguinolenta]